MLQSSIVLISSLDCIISIIIHDYLQINYKKNSVSQNNQKEVSRISTYYLFKDIKSEKKTNYKFC